MKFQAGHETRSETSGTLRSVVPCLQRQMGWCLLALFTCLFTVAVPANAQCEEWSAFGSGMNEEYVRSVVEFRGELIAGGLFQMADGQTVNYIARWDGQTWSDLGGGMNGPVFAVTVWNDLLVAGGAFTRAGGSDCNNIAAWDGVRWSALGTGLSDLPYALAVWNGDLIAGGRFTSAGGRVVNYVARWNGREWFDVGGGLTSYAIALGVWNQQLVVGGQFSRAGNQLVNNVALWNGSTWRDLEGGTNDNVHGFTEWQGDLIVCGRFTRAGSTSSNRVARWDGERWNALGSGLNEYSEAATTYLGTLIVTGNFSQAGGQPAAYIAQWDGDVWAPVDTGLNSRAACLLVRGLDLIVGGHFTQAGGRSANRIAFWRDCVDPLPPDRWTVIVHGRTNKWGTGTYEELSGVGDGWMWQIANRIRSLDSTPVEIHWMNRDDFSLYGGGDPFRTDAHHVVMFDWTGTSDILIEGGPNDGFAYAAGDALYAFLVSWSANDRVHALIGHSRGAVVVSEATRRLLRDGTPPTQAIYLDGEGFGLLGYGYEDSVFDAWAIEPPHREVRYDNIFVSRGTLWQILFGNIRRQIKVGGWPRSRAHNTQLVDFTHSSIPSYLAEYMEYDGTRFTFRRSDATYPPTRDPLPLGSIPSVLNGNVLTRNEAGWFSHGGGGNALMLYGYLSLLHGYPERVHSFARVASDANYVQFKVARGLGTNGNLVLTWNGAQFDTRAVRDIGLTWRTVRIPLPPSAPGNVGRLGFHVVETDGNTHVGIDDIEFIP